MPPVLLLILTLSISKGQNACPPNAVQTPAGGAQARSCVCKPGYFDVNPPTSSEPLCLTCRNLNGLDDPTCNNKGICGMSSSLAGPVCVCGDGYAGPACDVARSMLYVCGLRTVQCTLGTSWVDAIVSQTDSQSTLDPAMHWACLSLPDKFPTHGGDDADAPAMPRLDIPRAYLYDPENGGYISPADFCFVLALVSEWSVMPELVPDGASTLPFQPTRWLIAGLTGAGAAPSERLPGFLAPEVFCPWPYNNNVQRDGLDSLLEVQSPWRGYSCGEPEPELALRFTMEGREITCWPLWINKVLRNQPDTLLQYRCKAGNGRLGDTLQLDCLVQIAPAATAAITASELLTQCA